MALTKAIHNGGVRCELNLFIFAITFGHADRTLFQSPATVYSQTLAAMPRDILDNEEHNDINFYFIN